MVVEDDEEDVAEVVEAKSKRRRKGAPTVPATNGKAKGKTRAASTVNGHKNDADLVIIDELDDEEPSVARPPSPTKKGKTRAGSSFVVEEGEILDGTAEGTRSASSPELERMRAERDLVRPLSAPRIIVTRLTEHRPTVQSQERRTIRKHASANKGEKHGARGRASCHESAIRCRYQWCVRDSRSIVSSSLPLTHRL